MYPEAVLGFRSLETKKNVATYQNKKNKENMF